MNYSRHSSVIVFAVGFAAIIVYGLLIGVNTSENTNITSAIRGSHIIPFGLLFMLLWIIGRNASVAVTVTLVYFLLLKCLQIYSYTRAFGKNKYNTPIDLIYASIFGEDDGDVDQEPLLQYEL